jgi:hypothetical protein
MVGYEMHTVTYHFVGTCCMFRLTRSDGSHREDGLFCVLPCSNFEIIVRKVRPDTLATKTDRVSD